MSKWARKAKKLGINSTKSFENHLPSLIEEANRSIEDIEFIIKSFGVSIDYDIQFNEESLDYVESIYRDNYSKIDDIELFERLLALFLGQVLVNSNNCSWVIYPGKYHVYSPFVIKLEDQNMYVQPFLFCADLKNKGVQGRMQKKALSSFVKNRNKSATK